MPFPTPRLLLPSVAAAALLLAPATAPAATPAPVLPEYHVSPKGKDTNTGTAKRPLRTVTAALRRATAGQTVRVQPGRYPKISDQLARSETTTVVGTARGVDIAGAWLGGAQGLRFTGVKFSNRVDVVQHPKHKADQRAERLTFERVEMTAPSYALYLRGARYVRVLDSHIHDARSGIVGPGNAEPSHGVTIAGNVIERMGIDGIQFGDWHGVRIEDNTIQDLDDPTGKAHNDAIQFTGDTVGVVIRDNRLLRSGGQLLLIQDAFGPIDDVLVEGNTIADSAAYAIQSQGATRVRFIRNTVWRSRWGGLLLRAGRSGGKPQDTVVVGNILSGLRAVHGTAMAVNQDNWVPCTPPKAKAGQVVVPDPACVADPLFVDPANYDFRLSAQSPLRTRTAALGAAA